MWYAAADICNFSSRQFLSLSRKPNNKCFLYLTIDEYCFCFAFHLNNKHFDERWYDDVLENLRYINKIIFPWLEAICIKTNWHQIWMRPELKVKNINKSLNEFCWELIFIRNNNSRCIYSTFIQNIKLYIYI